MKPQQKVPFKIAVTGTGGSGKTTLAQSLAADLNLELIPELARVVCREQGYEYPGDISNQEEFKFQLLERQIKEEAAYQSFVADRCVIDSWVHWQRWNLGSAMSYDSERFYNIAHEHSRNYTHIIYVPPLFAPQEDGFRWTDPDYLKQIDRLIKMTLFDFDLWSKTYTVTSADSRMRTLEITKWLES